MARKRKPTTRQKLLDEQQRLRQLRDQERIDTIVQAANGVITQSVAALSLGVTDRQIRRLIKAYREGGIGNLTHQGRGKPSNHQSDEGTKAKVLEIIRDTMADNAPTLISDELSALHGIEASPTNIRRWMIAEGLWKPKSPGKVTHRRWRERKAHPGEMVQIDTSKHLWFGEDRDYSYCIGVIDDATSRLYVKFYDADSTLTNMDALEGYMRMYGRPLTAYMDKASHFVDNTHKGARKPKKVADAEVVTQIQRAFNELNITQILANSPQAKGRVERLFGTLQNRLPQMMKIRGITTIAEANHFLVKEFIPQWNKKFAKPPAIDIDLHRTLDGLDVKSILSRHVNRTVLNDYTFQYNTSFYQIDDGDMVPLMRRSKVTIEARLDGTFKVRFNGKYIGCHEVGKKTNK